MNMVNRKLYSVLVSASCHCCRRHFKQWVKATQMCPGCSIGWKFSADVTELKSRCWAGEMALWVNHLPHKREDQSLNPRDLHKCPVSYSKVASRDRPSPTSAQCAPTTNSKDTVLKKAISEVRNHIQDWPLTLYVCHGMYTPALSHTNMHTHM